MESAEGRLVIRVTSRLGEVHHALGSEPVKAPAHSTAVHVSAAQRYYGALLLRQAQHAGQQQLLAYVLPSLPAAGAGKDASGPPAAVPAVMASGAESERAAAVRCAACLAGWLAGRLLLVVHGPARVCLAAPASHPVCRREPSCPAEKQQLC